MADCQHKIYKQGPRIPLRYGSSATRICQICGMWRQDRPGFGDADWKPSTDLDDALNAEEQD